MLIGLAVGVDYSLFYIRREREERAKGHSKLDAIDIAAATSGRAVLLSGLTVMAAMAGMLLTDNSTFMSMGLSTILVVAVAVIGSLTVLPAVVAGLGDKLDKGRLPFLGRRQSQARESRMWGALTDRVMRHPIVGHRRRRRRARRPRRPRAGHADQAPGHRVRGQVPADHPDVPEGPEGVPERGQLRDGRREGRRRRRARGPGRDRRSSTRPTSTINPKHTVAIVNVGLPGSGVNDAAMKGMQQLRDDHDPGRVRQARRRRDRGRHRRGRGHRRLQRRR